MNKITEGKLRNFNEIDAFITIACPFSSMDSEEFKGLPILNAMEIYLGLNLDEWGKMDLFDYASGETSLLDILPEQKEAT